MGKWIFSLAKFFHRRGYGVHSPFVFDLITNVIEQPLPFYGYKEIEQARLYLRLNEKDLNYNGKRFTVGKYIQKYGISQKEAELLFRLANHYKPYHILSIGSSLGLIPLSLTGYVSHLHCISLERENELAKIARKIIEKRRNKSIQIFNGNYVYSLPIALNELKKIDCVYFEKELTANTVEKIYQQCKPFIHEETFLIISGIHTTSDKRKYWKQLCMKPETTVSVDLHKIGLIFPRPKLYKRMYKNWWV